MWQACLDSLVPTQAMGEANVSHPALPPVAFRGGESPDRERPSAGAFGRLAALVRSNDRLTAELASLAARRDSTLAYLAGAGANETLATARLDQIRRRRSVVLAGLRSNRIVAREFLGAPLDRPCPAPFLGTSSDD